MSAAAHAATSVRRRPSCSRCCRSAWTGSAARPWWAGRAAGADAPERSSTTAHGEKMRTEQIRTLTLTRSKQHGHGTGPESHDRVTKAL